MECFNLSEKFVCYNIFIVIVGIVICVAIVVNVCSQSTISRLFTRLQKIKWNLILKKYSIPVLIFLIAFAGIKLFIDVFHDGNWLVTKDTCISKNISDWGNFATCIGAFFALISIYLAYRAFISQVMQPEELHSTLPLLKYLLSIKYCMIKLCNIIIKFFLCQIIIGNV